MKRILCALTCFMLFIGIVGCGEKEEDVYDFKTITAKELVQLMKDDGLPIGRIEAYDEDSDLNELLGKPNEYIAKTDFEDTELAYEYSNVEYDGVKLDIPLPDYPYGGTIEIFNNPKDAKARYNYIDSVAHSGPLSMYMYLYDNVLIRIEKKASKEKAQQYEDLFNKINDGKIKKASQDK